jgi:sphingolipid 8-(E)-desaturase
MSKTTRWTRSDVANRILAGDTLVILNNNVLRIPQSWLSSHPGGSAAILHFVGRDATDEINAYHDDETLEWISRYTIGVLDLQPGQLWDNFLPPYMAGWIRKPGEDGTLRWYNEATDAGPSSPVGMLVKSDNSPCASPTLATITPPPSSLSLEEQAAHSAAYKELHEQIKQKGLYQTPYARGYGFEFATFILFGAIAAFLYQQNWLFFSACSLGAMWHQIVFTVHDLGHMGVTHDWELDRMVSIFLADFIGGLSIGWWVDVSNQPSYVDVRKLNI